ncbi:25171_t:CDS:2 [Dentiscutata erythropus]|uniref:25171_t:CDS:1 n=1 Tax=Dentiscutata erythropus TaxID=1348616 RepID=A0A9N9DRK9_9GLOM|nr:25171_t:CDS:2 [Dentiscutata erythropus]
MCNRDGKRAQKKNAGFWNCRQLPNESTKSEYISEILVGVVDTFVKEVEAKSSDIEHGFTQNLVQLKCACTANKNINTRKRRRVGHVNGVATTSEKWFFTVVTTEDEIGAIHVPNILHLHDKNIADNRLAEDVRPLFLVLRAIILERLEESSEGLNRLNR